MRIIPYHWARWTEGTTLSIEEIPPDADLVGLNTRASGFLTPGSSSRDLLSPNRSITYLTNHASMNNLLV